MPKEHSRSLFEIAKDISVHPELLESKEDAKSMLESLIHDSLIESWGDSLKSSRKEAVDYLKTQLAPCGDLFTETELKRIVGTEIYWLSQTQSKTGRPGVDLAAMRREFVSEVVYGTDPLLDPDSPIMRLGEMETYLRSWADFPAFGFGVQALDEATGGILPGEICVLTGAPGTMKTSLALSAVDNYISRTDAGLVFYCSVDMAPRQISMRLMERESRTPEAVLRAMQARNDPEYQQFRDLVVNKYNNRLVIRGNEAAHFMGIGELIQQCLKRRPQLVVVDYFTRLKAIGQSDLEFVETAMPMILSFSHEYEVSFLLLSQMSRSSRSDQINGRIGGHGKGGGIVEELAHTEIELLKQPVENDKDMVIAAITKARRGVSGKFYSLGYDGPIKCFDGTAMQVTRTTQRKSVFEPVNNFYDRPL